MLENDLFEKLFFAGLIGSAVPRLFAFVFYDLISKERFKKVLACIEYIPYAVFLSLVFNSLISEEKLSIISLKIISLLLVAFTYRKTNGMAVSLVLGTLFYVYIKLQFL